MNCANCDKETTSTLCPCCRKISYCGTDCAQEHWTQHCKECPNVIMNAPIPNWVVFKPSLLEELYDEQELRDALPVDSIVFQTYLVHHTDNAGRVSEQVQGDLIGAAAFHSTNALFGAGTSLEESLQNKPYSIRVTRQDPFSDMEETMVIRGQNNTGNNVIGRTGKENDEARFLYNLRKLGKKPGNDVVLWPTPDSVQEASDRSGLEFPLEGTNIRLQLYINDTELVTSIEGVLCFEQDLYTWMSKLRRKIASKFQIQMRKKLGKGGKSASTYGQSLKNLFLVRGMDRSTGVMAQLIFSLTAQKTGTVQLVDLEMSLPKRLLQRTILYGSSGEKPPAPPAPPAREPESMFEASAYDIDQVRGLIMALSCHCADCNHTDALAEEKLGVLVQHERQLAQLEDGAEIPPVSVHVSAAMDRATHILADAALVGRRGKAAFDSNYYTELKNMSVEGLEAEVDNLVFEKKKGAKGFLQKVTGKKGKFLGRIRAVQRVIDERIREKKLTFANLGIGRDEWTKDQDYVKLTELVAKIRKNFSGYKQTTE